jgi:hypothetical protein
MGSVRFAVQGFGAAPATVLRLLCACLALYAFVMAPVLVILTHPPTDPEFAEAAHVHVHWAWHDHGHEYSAEHDASDHEQQVRSLSVPAGAMRAAEQGGVAPSDQFAPPGTIREGPRRPPRLV